MVSGDRQLDRFTRGLCFWTCPQGTVLARFIEMERPTLKIEAPFPGPRLYKMRKWVEHKHSPLCLLFAGVMRPLTQALLS